MLAAAGLAAVLTGGGLILDGAGSAAAGPDIGIVPAAAQPGPPAVASPGHAVLAATGRPSSPGAPGPSRPARPGTPGPGERRSPRVQPPGPPVRLRLPGAGPAPVVAVGTVDGALEVPADPATLGWWSVGARPGAGVGSVVVDGHVDSARTGLGVFARLRRLAVGDPVVLVDAAGHSMTYTVTGRRRIPKADLAGADLFDQTVAERLVLITCGGAFDKRTRHYADNVVVFATPSSVG